MEVAQIFAEYLVPGLVFNCGIVIILDVITRGKLSVILTNPSTPDWIGNLVLLLLVTTSYFTGFLISSIMLDLSRPFRVKTATKVRGLSDLARDKMDILLRLGIASAEIDPSNTKQLTEFYNGLMLFVWKNSEEQILQQLRFERNRLVLARSMVIPILLFAIAIPFWADSLFIPPSNIFAGILLGLIALYTLRLNWRKGFQQGERTVKLARQYLEEIEEKSRITTKERTS